MVADVAGATEPFGERQCEEPGRPEDPEDLAGKALGLLEVRRSWSEFLVRDLGGERYQLMGFVGREFSSTFTVVPFGGLRVPWGPEAQRVIGRQSAALVGELIR